MTVPLPTCCFVLSQTEILPFGPVVSARIQLFLPLTKRVQHHLVGNMD
jgi:hypothetical protein